MRTVAGAPPPPPPGGGPSRAGGSPDKPTKVKPNTKKGSVGAQSAVPLGLLAIAKIFRPLGHLLRGQPYSSWVSLSLSRWIPFNILLSSSFRASSCHIKDQLVCKLTPNQLHQTEAEEQAAREANHARLLDRLLRQVTWAEEAVEHAAFEAEIAHIEYAQPVGAGLNDDFCDDVNEDAPEGWDADEQGPPSPRGFDAFVAHDPTGSN
ncbi:hypothetical protein N7467_002349 [Penicillium canescens]|nr:hypothetical protein N7467_002349 [Penicillium canescens]